MRKRSLHRLLQDSHFHPQELEEFGALEWTKDGAYFCLGNEGDSASWSQLETYGGQRQFVEKVAAIADRWGLEYVNGRYTL